ncbi:DUF6934 family protein [Daejeonella oryzae]|uniref:DUF6934 family protein n=1 Tax=Daejeonella oryzae TaxID=1122943 RepID=UPI0006882B12|nr:hypothetical protein [Daejeonella oryzae]
MNNEGYDKVRSSRTATIEYKFTSIGKKGEIEKIIEYKEYSPDLPNIYNLGFGQLKEDGLSIDDTIRSDNGDMEKVLSTVAHTIYDFTTLYSDRIVYLRGSCPVRTRIYQIAINKHYDEIIKDYDVHGHIYIPKSENSELVSYNELFQKNKNYYGFLLVRR